MYKSLICIHQEDYEIIPDKNTAILSEQAPIPGFPYFESSARLQHERVYVTDMLQSKVMNIQLGSNMRGSM